MNSTKEQIIEEKAREIYHSLRNEIDPNSNQIDLNRLRGIMTMFGEKIGMKEKIIDTIGKFKLKDYLLQNNVSGSDYNEKLSEQDFAQFLAGTEMKGILFDKSLIDRKSNVEELAVLYEMMNGRTDGISVDKLNQSLSKALYMYSDPEIYMRDDFEPDRDVQMRYAGESEDIITLLSSNGENLTVEDFVNAMTSETMVQFDKIKIESPNKHTRKKITFR